MRSIKVKGLMVPLDAYATVLEDATLCDAVDPAGKAFQLSKQGRGAIAYESKQFTTGEFFYRGIAMSSVLMVVLVVVISTILLK